MSISHWGIIPGYFAAGSAVKWGDPVPVFWVSMDFALWCEVCTREPIRSWPQ